MLRDKFEIIKKYIIGKDVLDCGCVGSEESGVLSQKFLHKKIAEHSKFLLGVDISSRGVQTLRKLGFNVIEGNVEEITIGRKFDVVIAGDLIEHLSNAGKFLENVKKHLNPDGVLIISTPNPFSITRFYHMLVKKHVEVNPDHTCYYDIMTLKQLLSRHGFLVVEIYYTNSLNPPFLKKLVIDFFIKISEGFADSILIVSKVRNNSSNQVIKK
jgi:2-polyprenyl-3-methyl-5-hydroxy-6-metoxy-1,4-benzoquinol methylase